MAGHTVAQIPDSLFGMFPLNAISVVTVVARIAGVAAGMASSALAACPAVVEREAVGTIEGSRAPGRRRVATGAVGAEEPCMEGGFGMAGGTSCGGPLELASGMAGGACEVGVRTCELESAQIMIEGRIRPDGRLVASSTVCPECPVMRVILEVASGTIRGRWADMTRGMAVAAGDTDMGLSQSEAGHGVIKLDTCPDRSVMALGAIVPQPPLVGVILSMAADAA